MNRFLIALVAFLAFVPLTASAASATFFGPIVPEICQQCPCGFGGVLAIIQNLMNFIVSISIIIMTLILVWGGFLYMTSPTNPESRSTANKMLINAVIGILIVLSAWLIVDFVMKTLYSGPDGQQGVFGPWNSIIIEGAGKSCIEKMETRPLFNRGITTIPGTVEPPVTVSGSIQARICAAASAYRGTSTSAGPSDGVLACAWAVNNVLRNASVGTLDGDSVRAMEGAIRTGRGMGIEQNSAVCGDIVMVTGQKNHVGICMNAGCSQVLSNSSSRKAFVWTSGPRFAPSYDADPKIFRITR